MSIKFFYFLTLSYLTAGFALARIFHFLGFLLFVLFPSVSWLWFWFRYYRFEKQKAQKAHVFWLRFRKKQTLQQFERILALCA